MWLHSLNRCDQPPWEIASLAFNEAAPAVRLQGVRQANPLLFDRLAQLAESGARVRQLHDYMDVRFQLHQWQAQGSRASQKSLKNSYLRFLRGWMFDANSQEGAVLKGWVESRFGLPPTFHRQRITDFNCPAYQAYLCDRVRGAARTSAIFDQLDLLYEFVQQELPCRDPSRHRVLYRGVNDLAEHPLVEQAGPHRLVLQLNNLNSFTSSYERAWEFGSRVLVAQVPCCKIFFQAELFPSALLRGEDEVLVIGGLYAVELSRGA